jgi:hypothetical protein
VPIEPLIRQQIAMDAATTCAHRVAHRGRAGGEQSAPINQKWAVLFGIIEGYALTFGGTPLAL